MKLVDSDALCPWTDRQVQFVHLTLSCRIKRWIQDCSGLVNTRNTMKWRFDCQILLVGLPRIWSILKLIVGLEDSLHNSIYWKFMIWIIERLFNFIEQCGFSHEIVYQSKLYHHNKYQNDCPSSFLPSCTTHIWPIISRMKWQIPETAFITLKYACKLINIPFH